jgi:hypothetical protein
MAHADGTPVTMVFTRVNGANDAQFYVSPYNGTMNGLSVVLFCDDVLNEVSYWQTWQANVTNLGTALNTNNFSHTRYGGVSSSLVFGNPGLAYQEVAWLSRQFASNPGSYVDLRYALWFLMNPNLTNNDTAGAQGWLNLAAQNYGSIDPSNLSIVTNTSTDGHPLARRGQVQEFIVQTPEPGTLALLVCGMFVLALRTLRRRQLSA